MLAGVTADGWLAAAVAIMSLLATGVFVLSIAGVRAILRMVRDIDKKQGAVNAETLQKVTEVHNKVDALIVVAAYQQGKQGMPLSQLNIEQPGVIGADIH